MKIQKNLLQKLPKVDEILKEEKINRILNETSREMVIEVIRSAVDQIRNKILQLKENETYEINQSLIVEQIIQTIEQKKQFSLQKVINATGIVLHTNLGRACLNREVCQHIAKIGENYSTLEYDIHKGARGSRYQHIERFIRKLSGAEAALVVNNNAAAVLLILNTIAKDRQVIVSRGELVEIGGAFRVPEIMEQSGAELLEVGTTNKTRLQDYENTINAKDNIGALLKVHTSNYKIVGFTEEVSLKEMACLGEKHNLPVIYDLGSGLMIDLEPYGIYGEPTIPESLASGVDILCFSGDKLFGGPQAGIIVGKKVYIDQMKKNPLTRAFRPDKLTLAALEATLRIYLTSPDVETCIPTLAMITMEPENIQEKANNLFEMIKNKVENCEVKIINEKSQVGGGSAPTQEIPTFAVSIKPTKISVNTIEQKLRNNGTPIIVRISQESVIIDLRTVAENELLYIANALAKILN
jgi:L-seryl-tRNA(Ser) seleniumtransferase